MRLQTHLRFTASSNQGDRRYMEDVFHYHFETKNSESTEILFGFFAIFDGHGGSEAAKFAKERLLKEITTRDGFWTDDDTQICQAIRDGFLSAHAAMWDEISSWPKTASGLPSTAGTTATVCFLRDSKLYIGHVGDSGVVLGKKDPDREDWVTQRLTREHKPESPCEKARIEALGGAVVSKAGVQRVVWKRPKVTPPGQPGAIRKSTTIEHIPFLSVSRSLGDLWSYDYAKDDYYVCPEPDVHVLQINPHVHKALILASDGLWNMLRPQDAIGCVQDVEREMEKRWFKTKTHNEPVALINPSQRLVRKAVARWRDLKMRADNTTALTILIDPPGPRKEEVVRRERHGRHLELVDGYSRTDYIIQNITLLRDLINSEDSDSPAPETASPKKLTNVTNVPSAVGGRKPPPYDSASTSNGVNGSSSSSGGGSTNISKGSAKSKSTTESSTTSSKVKASSKPTSVADGAEPEMKGGDSPRENREPSPSSNEEASEEEEEEEEEEPEEPEEAIEDEEEEEEVDEKEEEEREAKSSNKTKKAAAPASQSAVLNSIPAKSNNSVVKAPLAQKKGENSTAGTHPRLKRLDSEHFTSKNASETKSTDSRSGSPLGFSTPPASSRSRGRAIATARSRPSLPASLPVATKSADDPNVTQDLESSEDAASSVVALTNGDSQEKRINTRSVTKDNLPIGERTRTRNTMKRKLDGDCGGPHHEAESDTLTSLAPMDEQFVWDLPKKKARVSSGAGGEPTSPVKTTRAKRGTSETPSSPRRASAAKPSPSSSSSSSNADAPSTRSAAAAIPRSPAATNKKASTIVVSKLPTKVTTGKKSMKASVTTTTKTTAASPPSTKARPAKSATTTTTTKTATATKTTTTAVGKKSQAQQPTSRRSLTVEALKSIKPKLGVGAGGKKKSLASSPMTTAASKAKATTTSTSKKPLTTKNGSTVASRRKTMHL